MSFQPLPKPCGPPPYRLDLAKVAGAKAAEVEKAGKLVFQVTGNTGGVRKPEIQMAVSDAMQQELAGLPSGDQPAFLYLLGNIVFYYGEASNYYGQFYRPYAHYAAPIFAIPGNHDGQVPVPSAGAKSLEAEPRLMTVSRARSELGIRRSPRPYTG